MVEKKCNVLTATKNLHGGSLSHGSFSG